MDIKKIVQRLCHKYGCSDPYELAGYLEINIRFENLGTMQGYFHRMCRIKQVVINENLPEQVKKFVLAHELGHSIMHPDCNTPFLQSTFFSTDRLEIQANKFAAELIIQDMDLMEHWDFTLDQWAAFYGLPVEIIKLRFK